jgi:hypothetical protein
LGWKVNTQKSVLTRKKKEIKKTIPFIIISKGWRNKWARNQLKRGNKRLVYWNTK